MDFAKYDSYDVTDEKALEEVIEKSDVLINNKKEDRLAFQDEADNELFIKKKVKPAVTPTKINAGNRSVASLIKVSKSLASNFLEDSGFIQTVSSKDASSIGRRNTYYKLSMWSDDYEEEICSGWVYAGSKERALGAVAAR